MKRVNAQAREMEDAQAEPRDSRRHLYSSAEGQGWGTSQTTKKQYTSSNTANMDIQRLQLRDIDYYALYTSFELPQLASSRLGGQFVVQRFVLDNLTSKRLLTQPRSTRFTTEIAMTMEKTICIMVASATTRTSTRQRRTACTCL